VSPDRPVTDMADHPTNAERRKAPRTPQRPTQSFPPGIPKHALWDAAQPIAVWLTLLLTVSPAQWQLPHIGQVPSVTQTQVHLFSGLYWALLVLDALLGLLVLRGRWRRATASDRT
jgi:hypothetical protein